MLHSAKRKKLLRLIKRYRDGTATAEEAAFVESYYQSFDYKDPISASLSREEKQAIEGRLLEAIHAGTKRTGMERGGEAPEEETVVRRLSPVSRPGRMWWAAAAVLVLAGGGWLWINNKKNPPASIAGRAVTPDIAPGRTGAVLTLGDGTQMVLDSLGGGVIANQNGSQVVLKNTGLAYAPAYIPAGRTPLETMYNTLSTPKGRQFNVTLPDGTKVWLNSSSSLRYPTFFTGGERRVDITGEAYFEVTKDKARPFLVIAGQAEVDVLGTAFNINAYADEASINTTLMDGAVRVTSDRMGGAAGDVRSGGGQQASARKRNSVLLRPGQQAKIGQGAGKETPQGAALSLIQVENADTEKVLAWKNGAFNFDGAPLGAVMRQLSRWYDIEVVYEKGVPDIRFFGEMSRNLKLSDLLKALEESKVHFRIEEGRKLVVLK